MLTNKTKLQDKRKKVRGGGVVEGFLLLRSLTGDLKKKVRCFLLATESISKLSCQNNTGSLMLLTLVILGVIGFNGALLYKNLQVQHKAQLVKNQFIQYNFLALSLKKMINTSKSCTDLLEGQVFNKDSQETEVEIDSNKFQNKNFISHVGKGKFVLVNKGVLIDKILNRIDDNKLQTYKVELQVWLHSNRNNNDGLREKTSDFNYRNLSLTIPMYVNINSENRIKTCYGEHSQAAICERYGKVYDPETIDLNYKCGPDRQCIMFNTEDPSSCPAPAIKMAIGSFDSYRYDTSSSPPPSGISGSAGGGGALTQALQVQNTSIAINKSVKEMTRQFESIQKKKETITNRIKILDYLSDKLDDEIIETEEDISDSEAKLESAQKSLSECKACTPTCSKDKDGNESCTICPSCDPLSLSVRNLQNKIKKLLKKKQSLEKLQTEFQSLLKNFKSLAKVASKIEDLADVTLKEIILSDAKNRYDHSMRNTSRHSKNTNNWKQEYKEHKDQRTRAQESYNQSAQKFKSIYGSHPKEQSTIKISTREKIKRIAFTKKTNGENVILSGWRGDDLTNQLKNTILDPVPDIIYKNIKNKGYIKNKGSLHGYIKNKIFKDSIPTFHAINKQTHKGLKKQTIIPDNFKPSKEKNGNTTFQFKATKLESTIFKNEQIFNSISTTSSDIDKAIDRAKSATLSVGGSSSTDTISNIKGQITSTAISFEYFHIAEASFFRHNRITISGNIGINNYFTAPPSPNAYFPITNASPKNKYMCIWCNKQRNQQRLNNGEFQRTTQN